MSTGAAMADTGSITYRLMQTVFKYPILYDTQHPEHNQREQKDEAWEEVSRELDLAVIQAKAKWKNLRDSYIKYLRSTASSGADPNKGYSRWQWSAAMEKYKPFLYSNEVYKPRRVRYFQLSDPDASSRDSLPVISKREPDPLEFLEESEDSQYQRYLGGGAEEGVQSSTDECPPAKVRRTEAEEQPRPGSGQEMDPMDHLMLAYAKTIKCFSLRRQAETKMQIAQLIMRQELEEIEERQNRGGSRV